MLKKNQMLVKLFGSSWWKWKKLPLDLVREAYRKLPEEIHDYEVNGKHFSTFDEAVKYYVCCDQATELLQDGKIIISKQLTNNL